MCFHSKIKIFAKVRRQYAILTALLQPAQSSQFSKRILFGFSLFVYVIASQVIYIFYVANDFMEYIECISSTSGGTLIFVCFAAIVFKRNLLFKSIDNIERFIDTSKMVSNRYLWFFMGFMGHSVTLSLLVNNFLCYFQGVNTQDQRHSSWESLRWWNKWANLFPWW